MFEPLDLEVASPATVSMLFTHGLSLLKSFALSLSASLVLFNYSTGAIKLCAISTINMLFTHGLLLLLFLVELICSFFVSQSSFVNNYSTGAIKLLLIMFCEWLRFK